MFGDVDTHKYSNLPQTESYVHRFGPGLVLYWFGHAPIKAMGIHDDICISDSLPQSFLWPTGEFGRHPPTVLS